MPEYQRTITILLPEERVKEVMVLFSSLEPILDIAQDYLQEKQRELFESRGASVEEEWTPNLPSTEKRKKALGFGTEQMVRTGLLKSNIASVLSRGETSVEVGIPDSIYYAEYHQSGVPSINLPRRILVGTTESQVTELVEKIRDYLANSLQIPTTSIEVV